jgi:hypothetical protein
VTRGSRRNLPCAALALVLLATGCVTRPIQDKIFERDYTTIYLRSYKRGTSVVEKHYQHPFTLSPARAAHILSRIDVRRTDGDTKRTPAIPTESLYLIGEGLSEAFEKADPNQEILVQSIRRSKRLGIFDRKHLTSFLAYRQDDLLYLHLGVVDWPVPPGREDRLPIPDVGSPSSKFRVIPSKGMTLIDTASLSVAWQDPIFAKATRTRITPGGRVVRRTILMESPEATDEATPSEQTPAPLPGNLTPETLRALADLEDARRRGDLTETEYETERRRILQGDTGKP